MSLRNTSPRFGRVITAMVTPFDAAGKVDFAAAERLASHLVDHGSDGIVVSGTTGESATLTKTEKVELFHLISRAIGGRASVIAGVGSYSTQESIELAREAEKTGVDGFLVVAPYYNKPSQEGIYQHFRAIASAVDKPIVAYNVPGRTVTNIESSTAVRLSGLPNVVAIKEASKNLEQISEIVRDAAPGFELYSGDDGTTLPTLGVGGVGVVSVISHVNGLDIQRMFDAFESGNRAEAIRLHGAGVALTRTLFSAPSPTPTKTALQMLGILSCAGVRLPLVEATDAEREVIRTGLRNYGLLGD